MSFCFNMSIRMKWVAPPKHTYSFMIAPKDSIDSQGTETPLPNGASDIEGKAATASGERDGSRSSFNSKKTYVAGKLHTDIRVPFREISLAPTKSISGQIEGRADASPVILQNEPVP